MGDTAPEEILKGVLSAASKTNDTFLLAGNKSEILRYIENNAVFIDPMETGHLQKPPSAY